MDRLIIGLGNPGTSYEKTRHNMGFLALKAFAAEKKMSFRQNSKVSAATSQGIVDEKKVMMMLPLTYMNSSGEAVRQCLQEWSVPLPHLLVVCDDVALPFGKLRLRRAGSAGGHNGLKSIEEHLGSRLYPRLRIGVGENKENDLADHVLGRFTEEEQKELPNILERASKALEMWVSLGMDAAMAYINR